ncbi:MAG: response regulator [Candidatus Thiothrix putei]|uniref:histidine kinase n=1 Tax=Candidatus Thiothrix putei TaxID=3080811 RepID=A0AA95HC85_9GAMM|nr:MAG: response regulator [Candidatus Thiothrix putei]
MKHAAPLSWLAGLLLFLLSHVVAADTSTLILTDSQDTVSAAPFMAVLEDPSRQLTLQQVTSAAFDEKFTVNTSQNAPSFGRSRSAYWVRFTLINQSSLKWYALSDAFLEDEYDFYLLSEGQDVTAQYAAPVTNYRRPAWSLALPRAMPLQIYVRATNGDSAFRLPVELVTADAMLERSKQNYRLYAAIYGAMLVLAAYNLFLFFALREISYLSLVVHILAMTAVAHLSNPVFEGIGFLHDTGSHFFTTPLYIAIISFCLFTQQLLQTKYQTPRHHQLLNALIGVCLPLILITGWIPGGTLVVNSISMITMLVLFSTSITALRQGGRIARYFFSIFFFVLFLVAPNVLVLTFNVTHWDVKAFYVTAMPIGHLIFLLLLSVIQMEKVRTLREAMQRTAAANQAKSSFLATINHELRTPLNAITSLGTLLRLTTLTPKQAEYVSQLEQTSQHMSRLMGNVLDIAKIESNSLELQQEPFQLSIVMRQVHDLTINQAQKKGLSLVFVGHDSIPETLLGDRLRLTQILTNLLQNALRYTHEGTVTCTVERHAIPESPALRLSFSVRDTGIGIPAEKLSTIFDEFTQAKPTSNLSQDGIGLGLAISSRLVTCLGGTLAVESTVGKGSHFFFTLPFNVAHLETATTDKPPCRLPQGIRILLVDDEFMNRLLGYELLSAQGGNVEVAADGQSALLYLQQHPFDVVLLDINLTDTTGFDVLQWIRQHSPNPNIPVIALTAHTSAEVKQQCLAAGMNGFLNKPSDWQRLCQIILKAVNREDDG